MEPFIVLSTKRPELSLQIDGVSYEVPLPEQFTFREMLRFQESRKRLALLQAELSKPDLQQEGVAAAEKEVEELLDGVTNLILRQVPAEVRKKITDWERFALLNAFQQALAKAGGFLRETEKQGSPSPGESGSADSADSSEEPGTPGWTPRS